MENLADEDRKEVERELEEEMVEIQRRKLACFTKMLNDIIKKSDIAAMSGSKVKAQLSPEDLVYMVVVSVANKYGAYLMQFTPVVTEDVQYA
jgi:fructose-1-phosphate kinase PfkB-like protein